MLGLQYDESKLKSISTNWFYNDTKLHLFESDIYDWNFIHFLTPICWDYKNVFSKDFLNKQKLITTR